MSNLEMIKHLPTCVRRLYWHVRYTSYDQEPGYGNQRSLTRVEEIISIIEELQ